MTRARDIANFGDGIDTADIGDGQITAAKLNSTLDLTGKTVTLPSGVGGKVVDYNFELLTGSYNNLTSDTGNPGDTGMSITYTPTNASNTLIILGSIHFYRNAAGHNHVYLYKSGSNVLGGTRTMSGHRSSGGQFHSDSPILYTESAGSTSARTYNVYAAKRPGESGTLFPNDGSGFTSYLMVLEVAA